MEASERQSTIFDFADQARQHKMAFRFVEDTPLDGKHIRLDGRDLLSFASCSYLGLETDERLREGVRRAVDRYGTQFSSSRVYLSAPPYTELEAKLEKIFGGFVLPTSTTTLGHLSAVPVLCQEKDAILMDQMVHHSVQLAVTQARAQGSRVEMLRHNDWQALEEKLERLAPLYQKVWFLCDGVYSMFGDMPDAKELLRLLERFPSLHLYVDDAHGMSIAGTHGQGVHLSRMGPHPRMVLATSLNKAFASAGGCVVFPTAELRDRVRLCGGPYTFGGPVQPPMLGAALASATLHLSDEIVTLQGDLRDKVRHFNAELERQNLPLYETNDNPVFFIKCGPIRLSHGLVARMAQEGYFLTVVTYPAVPLKRSGVRISITRHHTKEDLSGLAQALGHHFPLAVEEAEMKRDDIDALFAFKSQAAERQRKAKLSRTYELSDVSAPLAVATEPARSVSLQVEYATTINAIEPDEWNALLGHRGTMNHSTLMTLERIFRDQPKPESNWNWHYFIVKDGERPVAATFFTDTLWKDDMLMRAEVSNRIEELRAASNDPYLLTSRALGMGTLLTEGNHLMLDRKGPWREALELLLNEVAKVQAAVGATSLVLRDLPEGDAEMDQAMIELGLVKVPILASHSIDVTTFTDEKDFLATLGSRTRRRVRAEVLDVQQHFTVKLWRCGIDQVPSPELLTHAYSLYQKVKARKRRLNTFDLPANIFGELWTAPGWELMTLHLAPEAGGPASGEPVAVAASCLNGKQLVGVVAGLDGVEREISVYRQLLWRMMLRAKELGASTLELGMDAEREKLRMGAVAREQCSYAQVVDHSSAEILEQVVQEVSLGKPTAT